MFSLKVITAIKIIQELEPFFNKREGVGSRRCVVSFKEFPDNEASTLIFKSVLAVMLKNRWIDKVSRGYFLLINPEVLTLYSIYTTFHGGIPLGESADTRLNNFCFCGEKYENLGNVERDVIQKLTIQFKNIGYADMRTVPLYASPIK